MRLAKLLVGLMLVFAACGGGGGSVDGPLGELRSLCAAGEYEMCDILFQASDFESDLETFADTCGGRVEPSGAFCADEFGLEFDLDELQASCGTGDMVACDLLYVYSPFGSEYEAFGEDCGGLGEGDNRTCVVSYGFTAGGG